MDKEVRRLAHQFFITYKISKVTLPDIKRIIESQGFVIIRFNGLGNQPDVDSLLTCLDLQSIAARSRGFTYVDSHFRLVFIHESLSDDEMLAVLAHEEGHIYCGHMQYNSIIGQDIKEEMEATEFAICIMEEHKAIEAEIWLRSHRWLTSTIALLVIVFSIVIVKYNEYKAEPHYVTATGTKYHREACIFLKGKENVRSITRAEEKSGDFEPCKVCLP